MAGPIRISVLADASQASREFGGVSKDASRMGGAFKTAAKVAAAAMVVAGVAVVKFGSAAVKAASDAEQSLGATETVFGKFAGEVIKTSNRAAAQFGLSGDEYRNNANILGSLFKNQGVALDQLAGKTKGMIGVASDLSATFGGTTADAVEALGSAFKGEFDPLEKYGISVKQATITTAAWAIAGVDSAKAFGELTAQQQAHAKQLATTDLLMGQAAQTTGAFAKESDTLAHRQQVLGSQFTNLKTRIGTALLPVVTDLFGVLSKNLMPVLNRLATKFLPPVTKALHGWVKSGGAAKLFTDIGDAVQGISWAKISTGFGDISENLDSVDWAEVGQLIKELGGALSEVSAETATDTLSLFNEVVGFAADHTETLRKALPYLTGAFLAFKSAQVLNQLAGRDSLIGLGLQLAATTRLTKATRDLANAQTQQTGTAAKVGSSATQAAGRLSRFGGAARGAAGLAGLGLVASAADDTSGSLKTFKSVAGGAMAGFAVGGPWGAAVGGAIGLFGSLMSSTDDAAQAARDAVPDWSNLAGTLDQVTGAITQATRAQAVADLAQSGAFEQAQKLGISKQTLVDASLGEVDALAKVTQARKTQTDAITALKAEEDRLIQSRKDDPYGTNANDIRTRVEAIRNEVKARQTNLGWLDKTISKSAQARKDARELIRLSTDWDKALKGLPDRAITHVEAKGIPDTLKGVAKLAEKYALTPKQIKTVLQAADVDKTVADVKKVQKALEDTGKKKTNPRVSVDSIPANRDLSTVTKKIDAFGKKTPKPTLGVTDQASSVLSTLDHELDVLDSRVVTVTVRTVRTGGGGPGDTGADPVGRRAADAAKKATANLLEGITDGLFLGPQETGPIESAMAADIEAVLGKIEDVYDKRAEKSEQHIGRVFNKRQKNIEANFQKARQAAKKALKEAQGLGGGGSKAPKDETDAQQKVRESRDKAASKRKAAAVRQAQAALDALDKAEQKRLRQLDNQEDARVKAEKKRWQARAKAAKAAIKEINQALKANARAQDEANDRLALAKEELEKLKTAADDFATSIKQSFVDFGNVVGLGVREARGRVTVTADSIVADLKARVAKATQFAADIAALTAAGLDESVIKDLLAAGPEAAGATAAAIAAGGPEAIAEINTQTEALAATGETLGAAMVATYNQAGIDAAQAVVDGINAEIAGLVAAEQVLLERLGATLDEEGKKRGKSAGKSTADGLYSGLVDNEKVTEAGKEVAKNLIKAFKDELKIKSPSQVFQELGELTGKGLTIGLKKTPAKKAGQVLATDLVDGFGAPTLSAQAALSSQTQTPTQVISVHLTADQLDQLARGRQYNADINAWQAVGGKYAS